MQTSDTCVLREESRRRGIMVPQSSASWAHLLRQRCPHLSYLFCLMEAWSIHSDYFPPLRLPHHPSLSHESGPSALEFLGGGLESGELLMCGPQALGWKKTLGPGSSELRVPPEEPDAPLEAVASPGISEEGPQQPLVALVHFAPCAEVMPSSYLRGGPAHGGHSSQKIMMGRSLDWMDL